jgi:hypothetical protein
MSRIIPVIALICASAWLAVNAVLAGMVAPVVFSHAPPHPAHDYSRSVAGAVFGDLLGGWVAIVDVSLLPVLLLLLAWTGVQALRAPRRWCGALALAAVVALASLHWASRATVIEATSLRPPTREADEAAYDEAKHERFDLLHHRSVNLFSAETLVLLGVVVVLAIAVARRRDGLGPSAPAPAG